MPIAETSYLQFMHIVIAHNFIFEIIKICSVHLWNFHLLSTKLKFFLKPTLTLKHYISKEESEEINMHQENLLVISIKYYLDAMLTS